MSINRDMQKCILRKQLQESARSPSGAVKHVTEELDITAAIYKKNDMRNTDSLVYNSATHTGLTTSRDIRLGDKIVKDDVVYEIIGCNTESRLSNLILKVVE